MPALNTHTRHRLRWLSHTGRCQGGVGVCIPPLPQEIITQGNMVQRPSEMPVPPPSCLLLSLNGHYIGGSDTFDIVFTYASYVDSRLLI